MTQAVAVTDSHLYFSPYNWYSDGAGALAANNINGSSTFALTNNVGAYIKFGVTTPASGTVTLNLDTTSLNGASAGTTPTLYVYVDGALSVTQALPNNNAGAYIFSVSSLASGYHQFRLVYKSNGSIADQWVTPSISVKLTGITIDDAATMANAHIWPISAIVYGDSITIGSNSVGSALANADSDVTYAWSWLLPRLGLNCEIGIIGFAGQGYARGIANVAPTSSAPSFYNVTAASQSWDKYWGSHSRLVGGLFSPVPTFILIAHGQNDSGGNGFSSTVVTSVVDAIRTAAGTSCWIFCVKNPSGANSNGSAIQTGVGNAALTTRSKEVVSGITQLITPGTACAFSNDAGTGGSHPNILGHANFGANTWSVLSGTYSIGPRGRQRGPRTAVASRSSVSRTWSTRTL